MEFPSHSGQVCERRSKKQNGVGGGIVLGKDEWRGCPPRKKVENNYLADLSGVALAKPEGRRKRWPVKEITRFRTIRIRLCGIKKREGERRAAKGYPPPPARKSKTTFEAISRFFQRLNVFGPLQSRPPRPETDGRAWVRASAVSRAAWAGPLRPRRARKSILSAAA